MVFCNYEKTNEKIIEFNIGDKPYDSGGGACRAGKYYSVCDYDQGIAGPD